MDFPKRGDRPHPDMVLPSRYCFLGYRGSRRTPRAFAAYALTNVKPAMYLQRLHWPGDRAPPRFARLRLL